MLNREFFHHPDISVKVLRRRACDELLEMLLCYGAWAARTRPLMWNCCFKNRMALHSALHRLRKSGLLVHPRKKGGQPVLRAVESDRHLAASRNPERFWNQKWSGRWNVLVYDIPEKNRHLRDTLRHYLYRLRMGCLQQSTWVSPHDVRPDYSDLQQAIGVEGVSFLFEARTVLGRRADDIVHTAWDFDRIDREHGWYLALCSRNLQLMESPQMIRARLETMAREESAAYFTAMDRDPLLPETLRPSGYKGRQVFDAHNEFVARMRKALRRSAAG